MRAVRRGEKADKKTLSWGILSNKYWGIETKFSGAFISTLHVQAYEMLQPIQNHSYYWCMIQATSSVYVAPRGGGVFPLLKLILERSEKASAIKGVQEEQNK